MKLYIMRPFLSLIAAICISMALSAQNKYPIPEFSNEVYWYQKDSNKVVRLEKNTSKVDTKTKMGGMGAQRMAIRSKEKDQQ
jgi:hypothetical protein